MAERHWFFSYIGQYIAFIRRVHTDLNYGYSAIGTIVLTILIAKR